jgi:Uma2 family endonuclease
MQQPARKYYTPDEYLALEQAAEFKSEYYQGEIFAMAGSSLNHSRIVLKFSSVDFQIILREIYERVKFQ